MSDLIDDAGIHLGQRTVAWDDVVAVGLRTTADAPFAEDVFWQLLLRDGFIELPGGLVVDDSVSVLHRHLPGLDSLKIVVAMGSTEERIFRLWHRNDSPHRWADDVGRARFRHLVTRLGGSDATADGAFEHLAQAWRAPERRYHTLEHLGECLRLLDAAGLAAPEHDLAELALWYHDAVYAVPARDNEERSARLLIDEGTALAISSDLLRAAAELVRATAHLDRAGGATPLAQLVVDIDLAVLGSDPLRFMEFEYGVEAEYASVPTSLFRVRRGAFLASLLGRPTLFGTAALRQTREIPARANLEALLASPRYRIYRWVKPFLGRSRAA